MENGCRRRSSSWILSRNPAKSCSKILESENFLVLNGCLDGQQALAVFEAAKAGLVVDAKH